jgi:phage terminase large subunit-like protein
MNINDLMKSIPSADSIKQSLARHSHLEFMKYTWDKDSTPFLIGYHTKKICDWIDTAFDNYKKGINSYAVISVPHRHGKLICNNTTILTNNRGWITHGELKVGDTVFGRSGEPVKVLAEGNHSINPDADHLIKFSDGSEILAHAQHEWVVYDKSKHRFVVLESQEIRDGLLKDIGYHVDPKIGESEVRTIISIEIVEAQKGKCIQVEGGVYLVGENMIPTHNSQLVSRSLVPHFLGEFDEGEVITASYNSTIAERFSKEAKSIIESDKFLDVYPWTRLDSNNRAIKGWGLDNQKGQTLWSGIDGALIGAGANLLIVDDPFKGRGEAKSMVIRDKRWEAFTEAAMTRLAPVHIVVVIMTRWDEDDIVGRINKEMESNPHFPKFDQLVFPARNEDYEYGDYGSEFLFPDRFTDEWYNSQYATLGSFASSALLDCNPKPKGGNILGAQEGVNWQWVNEKPGDFGRLYRAWDLASTKQNAGSDPDYTVGVKGAIKVELTKIVDPVSRKVDKLKTVSIYIDDIIRMREEATKRNTKMVLAAANDGSSCIHFVESFGSQKDTVSTLKSILGGSRIVKGVRHKGDKDFKITEALEVPLSMGNVFISRKVDPKLWEELCEEIEGYPFVSHDDFLDALSILVTELTSKQYSAWWRNK